MTTTHVMHRHQRLLGARGPLQRHPLPLSRARHADTHILPCQPLSIHVRTQRSQRCCSVQATASEPAAAAKRSASTASTPQQFNALVERLEGLVPKHAEDGTSQGAEQQPQLLSELCKQLAASLHTSGGTLSPRQLVQLAGVLKHLHKAMGADAFSSSPAQPVLHALVDTAISSRSMQQPGTVMITSWSMLLHSLAACRSHVPHMQQLLDTAMAWYRSQGPSIWAKKGTPDGLKPAAVSLTLWAYAVCGYTGDLQPLVEALNAAAEAHVLRGSSPQEWSTLVWSMAKLGMPAKSVEPVWRRAHLAIAADMGKGKECNAQDISMAMYAAAVSEWTPAYRPFTARLRTLISLKRWHPIFHNASPQASATTLFGLSKMMPHLAQESNEHEMEAEIVLRECVAHLERHLKQMTAPGSSPQTLITAVLSMASLRCFKSNMFNAAISMQLQQWPGASATLPVTSPAAAGSSNSSSSSSSGASEAVWKLWTLDAVTLLYACAQVYPGLQHGLRLMLAQPGRKPERQPPAHPEPAQPAEGSVQGDAATASEGADEEQSDARPDMAVMQDLLTQVREWIAVMYELMGRIPPDSVAQWDSQTLTNFLWAWAALQPSTYQYSGGAAQVAGTGAGAVQEAQQAAACKLAAAVFSECARRGASEFTTEGLMQLFTAHVEATERGLTAVGPAGLDRASPLITAARQVWQEDGQSLSSTTTSRSQTEVKEALERLGYTVEGEALTGPRSPSAPSSSAPAAAAAAADLEPLRVDLLITRTPSGRPCNVAVEFDGPTHFMRQPKRMYTGGAALRHAQVQRRVDHLMVVTSKEWTDAKAGKKMKQRQRILAELMQHKMQGIGVA